MSMMSIIDTVDHADIDVDIDVDNDLDDGITALMAKINIR